MADRETNTAPAIPTAELDRLATEAGMMSVLPDGDGAFVWSAGCNGVTAEHLERFAELVAARALAVPAAQGATREPVLIIEKTGALIETEPTLATFNLPDCRHELYAAPVGQAEDAARYRWLRGQQPNSLILSRNDGNAPNYMTVKQWVEECVPDQYADVPADELQRMKDADTDWALQIYPRTPISFAVWHAATLDGIIDAARAQQAQQAGRAETGEPT